MSIAIVSANTGNGHRAVMDALVEEFRSQNYNEIYTYGSFYEDCLISNKILSDFYNFLLAVSIPLGEKYTELAVLTRPDMSNEIYNASINKLQELIELKNLTTIISTAPLINNNLIRILRERKLTEKIKFYIIVTDPFDPIAPGFDIQGASGYFCFTNAVKEILVKSGIKEKLIYTASYPVSKKFFQQLSKYKKDKIYKKYNLKPSKKTVLINSGAYGNKNFVNYLKQIYNFNEEMQVIFTSGKNKALMLTVDKYIKDIGCKNILSLPFVDNLHEYLNIADLYIAKPGANTFFECIATNTFMIIDAVDGLLYQERGVKNFVKNNNIGVTISDYQQLPIILDKVFYNIGNDNFMSRKINRTFGAKEIVNAILQSFKNTGESYGKK